MKKILFLLVFFVSTAWAQIPTDVIERARDATVLVASNNKVAGGFGSGVVIDPMGLVLTNYHVIHRAETLRVWFYDPTNNNNYLADVVAIDPVADLALKDRIRELGCRSRSGSHWAPIRHTVDS